MFPIPDAADGASASAPATPAVTPDIDFRRLTELYPPHRVVLHDDDVHAMDEVVAALVQSVPSLGERQAVLIMLEAHITGRATVIVCAREQAEYYADRLGTFGLSVTIELAE